VSLPVTSDRRFVCIARVASGSISSVYRARDTREDRLVALKVLEPGMDGPSPPQPRPLPSPRGVGSLDPEPITLADHAHSNRGRRFLCEAQILAKLSHPAIVPYVAHGFTDEGLPYLAMSWIEGETLATRLARADIGVPDSMRLGRRLAHALGSAHELGIVHRDLKPSNVMLSGEDLHRATLIDFGVAHTSQAAPGTNEGCLLGTLGYLAPEQARGDANLDARVDVFGLGCLIYRLVTGRLPFEGDDAFRVLSRMMRESAPRADVWVPGLPLGLVELLARMLAVDPAERPRNGEAVGRELDRLLLQERLTGQHPENQPTLGTNERQLATVVMVERTYPAGKPSVQPLSSWGAEPPTLVDESAVAWLRAIRSQAKPYGASLRALGSSRAVLVFPREGKARDDRERAVNLALTLRNAGVAHDIRLEIVLLRTGGEFFIEPISALRAEDLTGPRLIALMQAQLAQHQLSPQARRTLRAGSLCGSSFSREELLVLLGSAEDSGADEALRELTGSGFLLPHPRGFTFPNDLSRRAAHASIVPRDLTLALQLVARGHPASRASLIPSVPNRSASLPLQ
jgi:eukaryotic-like serine/threonine-protein kinase